MDLNSGRTLLTLLGAQLRTRTPPQLSRKLPQVHPQIVKPRRRWLSHTTPRAAQSQQSMFTYNIAASYIAKDRPYDPSTHVFHFDPYNRVRPPKRMKGKASRPESGQDAFFVSRIGDSSGVALGVADGVGGWMDSGVDPADFSHSFCDYMASTAYEHGHTPAGPEKKGEAPALTARQLIQKGYEAVCHDSAIKAGGSTAIVGLLAEDGTLEVANLGDSGFMQLRLNAVHAFSEPQIHAFNTPFQLSVVPATVMLRVAAFGGAQLSDLPRDAEVSRHVLRHGDVLVFASDGLWDNLFDQDILHIVSQAMTGAGAWVNTDAGVRVVSDLAQWTRLNETGRMETSADEAEKGLRPRQRPVVTLQSALATAITGAAKAASVNTKLDGPFAKEVKKYYPSEPWRGGKVDDICVVVVVVSETSGETAKCRL